MKIENFIKGKGLLNMVICFLIVFLAGTYFDLLTKITKYETIFSIKFVVVCFGAIAFGLLTFAVIRNVDNVYIKIVFSLLEASAVLLHYQKWDEWYIDIFVAVLCSAGVFTLAYISTEKDKSEKEVSTELHDLQQSNSQLTAELHNLQSELLGNKNELLNTQNELLQVTESKKEVTAELLAQTSLLSEMHDYSALKDTLQESRGEVQRLKEFELLWNAKIEAERITNQKRGQRKNV